MGNMPANPVVCPSGPMNGSPVAEELKTFTVTGITKNYKAQKIGITQKKLNTFPADSSHVRALTNISTKNQKNRSSEVNTTQSFKKLSRITTLIKFTIVNYLTL